MRQLGHWMRLGGKVGRAIQGHQELIPEDPETVEQVVLVQARKDLKKDGVEMAWGDRIEEGADVIVTGNLRDAKQGVGVIAALGVLGAGVGTPKTRAIG